jgi:ABC-type phosphate transport system substrate-binding protein
VTTRVMAAARMAGALALASLAVAGYPATAQATSNAASTNANSYVDISGSGSSWAAVAIDQWAEDERPYGLVVNYNPDGSAAGRDDYMSNQDDFAGSDPPFRNGDDELAGTGAENPTQGYSYVPDVAGGTAFMYHLTVAGHLITNLRLSGETLMKIFTGQITNWDDPEITHDYGAQLPNLPITPVIRSDGSGATYFLTRWMEHEFPAAWNAFCQQVHPGIKQPCPQTEFYPDFGDAKAENGSNNVATYITSSYGNGAIGYDEYAYALNSHYPVVAMLNADGYYVLPSAGNVSVALTQAQINEDPSSPNFLQQDLDDVYSYKDPRSYPLSSYSYFIVPRSGTTQPTNFTDPKGATLSTWLNFDLCAGQAQVIQLGYAPLPVNLVRGGLMQIDRIPGHVATTPLTSLANCNNPTFVNGQDVLLNTAPQPSPCAKQGEPLDCQVVDGKAVAPGGTVTTASGKQGTGKQSAGQQGTGQQSTGKQGTGTSVSSSTGPGTGSNTGTSTGTGTTQNAGVTATTGPIVGVPVTLASADPANEAVLGTITAVSIIVAVAAPPVLAAWLRRRKRDDQRTP